MTHVNINFQIWHKNLFVFLITTFEDNVHTNIVIQQVKLYKHFNSHKDCISKKGVSVFHKTTTIFKTRQFKD